VRRLALETRVLDGCANGRRRVRSLDGFRTCTGASMWKKAGKMARNTFQRGGRSPSFFCGCLGSPTCPRGDGVPRQRGSRDGRSGNNLWTGLTVCKGGINERSREEGFLASLSSSISGKPEVPRELDKVGPSPLSNADRPRPVGTPVRWEQTVPREGREAVSFCFSCQVDDFMYICLS
jgi:hypothetical protein